MTDLTKLSRQELADLLLAKSRGCATLEALTTCHEAARRLRDDEREIAELRQQLITANELVADLEKEVSDRDRKIGESYDARDDLVARIAELDDSKVEAPIAVGDRVRTRTGGNEHVVTALLSDGWIDLDNRYAILAEYVTRLPPEPAHADSKLIEPCKAISVDPIAVGERVRNMGTGRVGKVLGLHDGDPDHVRVDIDGEPHWVVWAVSACRREPSEPDASSVLPVADGDGDGERRYGGWLLASMSQESPAVACRYLLVHLQSVLAGVREVAAEIVAVSKERDELRAVVDEWKGKVK
jgi:hypothetical protein